MRLWKAALLKVHCRGPWDRLRRIGRRRMADPVQARRVMSRALPRCCRRKARLYQVPRWIKLSHPRCGDHSRCPRKRTRFCPRPRRCRSRPWSRGCKWCVIWARGTAEAGPGEEGNGCLLRRSWLKRHATRRARCGVSPSSGSSGSSRSSAR